MPSGSESVRAGGSSGGSCWERRPAGEGGAGRITPASMGDLQALADEQAGAALQLHAVPSAVGRRAGSGDHGLGRPAAQNRRGAGGGRPGSRSEQRRPRSARGEREAGPGSGTGNLLGRWKVGGGLAGRLRGGWGRFQVSGHSAPERGTGSGRCPLGCWMETAGTGTWIRARLCRTGRSEKGTARRRQRGSQAKHRQRAPYRARVDRLLARASRHTAAEPPRGQPRQSEQKLPHGARLPFSWSSSAWSSSSSPRSNPRLARAATKFWGAVQAVQHRPAVKGQIVLLRDQGCTGCCAPHGGQRRSPFLPGGTGRC